MKLLQEGLAHHRAGRLEQASGAYRAVLKDEPKEPNANRFLGAILMQKKEFERARKHLLAAIAAAPLDPENHYILGRLYFEEKCAGDATKQFRECVRLNPGHVAAHIMIAVGLLNEGDYRAALEWLDRALAIDRRSLDALINKAEALIQLNRIDDAWKVVAAGVALDASSPGILMKRFGLHADRGANDRAFRDLQRVLQLTPGDRAVWKAVPRAAIAVCDWTYVEELVRFTEAPIEGELFPARQAEAESLYRISWKGEAATIRNYAMLAAGQTEAQQLAAPASAKRIGDRLRVGYLSSDLRDHAVGRLAKGFLAAHDDTAYDFINFSVLADDPSDTCRQAIQAAFHENYFLDKVTDRDLAETIHAKHIDILVELNGWTQHSRLRSLSFRPAPVQISYLGYPGTTGAAYVDYIIGDMSVTPPGCEGEFTERPIRLPHSYLPFDRNTQPEIAQITRSDCGLPENATVFCAFNAAYKLTDDLADSWARILSRVSDSVLWLRYESGLQVDNLRREFAARGIAPDRLVFAQHEASFGRHLGRHRLATLFLDTFYYNAHTTGLDALFAGLPVVTKTGPTFAGRVGTSFLRTLGLTDLITSTTAEYENLAVALAEDPTRLTALKQRLTEANATSPLFDPVQTARNLEAAYVMAWERQSRGLPPESFDVPPIA
ncbi:MAG: tetratricopeptide repeat protein [Ancalomicrobiaceae bacterium]|nr:tetratricopeptide repeat protein [Ancalomicrobiaceae bacterium]